MPTSLHVLILLLAPAIVLMFVPVGRADSGDFVLIQNKLESQHIHLVEVGDDTLVHLQNGLWVSVDLDQCIALFDSSGTSTTLKDGILILTDGQRFPGEAIDERSDASTDELGWSHRWLGRIDVPLDDIDTVIFRPGTRPPVSGETDTLLLANGDQFNGFIVSLYDPVVIEVTTDEGAELIEVPRANVAAVKMISAGKSASGRRVWFDDGTVFDVNSLQIGDDGFIRLTSMWHTAGTKPAVVKLSLLKAIQLDPDRLLPLATLEPDRIEGSRTRYTLPAPKILNRDAPLRLSPIEFRGPIIARYILPPGCRRFACEAVLPVASRQWADFEFIIRNNDEELFRQRINSDNPSVKINVPVTGSEMTIELTEGEYGPIQDELILQYPMLLLERN